MLDRGLESPFASWMERLDGVEDDPEGVEKGKNLVAVDLRHVKFSDHPDGRRVFLSDPDFFDVIAPGDPGLAVEDGIQAGLVDVDVDPVGVFELGREILPQLADVHDDPGMSRVGVGAEVIDLDGRLSGRPEGGKSEQAGAEGREKASGCQDESFMTQFLLII